MLPTGFTAEIYLTFKEQLAPMSFTWFEAREKNREAPDSFYKACTMLIPKLCKEGTEIDNCLIYVPNHKKFLLKKQIESGSVTKNKTMWIIRNYSTNAKVVVP